MIFDWNLGKILMFGGQNETDLFADLWAYDGVNWQVILLSGTLPTVRSMTGFAFDKKRHVAVLHGGKSYMSCFHDTWEFDGIAWIQVATFPSIELCRFNFSFAYDDYLEKCVLFGGFYWGQPRYNDTWEFDGQTWTETSPSSAPEGRAYHCMIYNSKIQKTVLFGGSTSGPDNHDLNDTWVYSRMTNSHVPTLKFSVLVLIVVFLSFLFLKRSHIV